MKELLSTAANYLEHVNHEDGKRTPMVEVAVTTCEPIYRLNPIANQLERRIDSYTIRFTASPDQLRNMAKRLESFAENSETMHSMKEDEKP